MTQTIPLYYFLEILFLVLLKVLRESISWSKGSIQRTGAPHYVASVPSHTVTERQCMGTQQTPMIRELTSRTKTEK